MENKFLKRFDLVKAKFNKKIKDNLFKEEIEAFKKYNIIDENNMFNYIYIHNIYQYLIENPLEYKVNIISENNEDKKEILKQLFNDPNLDFNYNKNFSYKTYINFKEKSNNNVYDLYSYNEQDKKLLLNNKTIKEIDEYLNNNENNDDEERKEKNEILITSENYVFNSYPSIQFNFYLVDNSDEIKKSLEKEYIEKNEKLILIQKNILEEYFNNKNTLYLNDQIYYRNTLLLSTLNIFLYNDEEWEKNKENIIEKIQIKEVKENKDIIINNLICNFNSKILYYSDKEKERDLFNSNNSIDDETNFNLLENIYKQTFTHFKNEMNYIKTTLLNFNSLINDHMKLTYNENNPLKDNEDVGDYLRNSIFSLIQSLQEEYLETREKKYIDFMNDSKNELINNISDIKQEIDQKYFITNSSFDYMQEEISKRVNNYEKEIFDFLKEIDNLNINIFYDFKKILNEQGIFSINFDGLIKVVAVKRISIQDPIKNLMQNHKNSFGQILTSFGISGVVGGATSFLAGRAASVIGTDAIAGTFGGPIGIGVGIAVGFGTLFGQARYHYKKNRELINSIYDDMNKNVMDTISNVEDFIKKEMEKINKSMEKDIQEIKIFINILIDRVIKLLAE